MLTRMIITHATNAQGQRRVYLGGKSSLECWVEPNTDGFGWTLHVELAVTGNPIAPEAQRDCAIQILFSLAHQLEVAPADLKSVPFERIAALHTGNPFECRRIAVPRSKAADHCFMASAPSFPQPGHHSQRHEKGQARRTPR